MQVIDVDTRNAIETLICEFSYLIDHGEATAIPDLFTEDGSFESPLATLKGRESLTAAMAQRALADHNTRHVISNVRLTQKSPDEASGTVVLTLYRWSADNAEPLPVALIEYADTYSRNSSGGWRFASRTAHPVLSQS